MRAILAAGALWLALLSTMLGSALQVGFLYHTRHRLSFLLVCRCRHRLPREVKEGKVQPLAQTKHRSAHVMMMMK